MWQFWIPWISVITFPNTSSARIKSSINTNYHQVTTTFLLLHWLWAENKNANVLDFFVSPQHQGNRGMNERKQLFRCILCVRHFFLQFTFFQLELLFYANCPVHPHIALHLLPRRFFHCSKKYPKREGEPSRFFPSSCCGWSRIQSVLSNNNNNNKNTNNGTSILYMGDFFKAPLSYITNIRIQNIGTRGWAPDWKINTGRQWIWRIF